MDFIHDDSELGNIPVPIKTLGSVTRTNSLKAFYNYDLELEVGYFQKKDYPNIKPYYSTDHEQWGALNDDDYLLVINCTAVYGGMA